MPANKTKSERTETAARVGQAKILIFDVELSPNIGYTWGTWQQNVIKVISHRQIISFAWKWLGEREVKVLALPSFRSRYKRNPNDNKALVYALHRLMRKADIIVAHNGDKFDDKVANTDFIKHGLKPPPPHKSVDTLKVAKAKFRFNSNRLGELGSFLGLGQKVETGGFGLWEGCLRGERKSWDLMMRYNQGDVRLLEKIYLKLRPWMTNHPNLNKPDGHVGCPVCRSTKFRKNGYNRNKWGSSIRFRCLRPGCGKTFSGSLVRQEWRMG